MKLFWGIIIGAVGLALISFLVVGIASLVNDVSMPQQIVNWFGTNAPVIEETVEQVAETMASVG